MQNTKSEHGSSVNAAWADHEYFEKDTHVNIPSEEAVELAKSWVETHEL